MIRAFESGARGYLLKDVTEADLARHVLNLHAGGSPISPIIARRLLTRMTTPAPLVDSRAPTGELRVGAGTRRVVADRALVVARS